MKRLFTFVATFVCSFTLHAQVAFNFSSSPGVGSSPYVVTAADVNGDGKPDLITANSTGNSLTVLTNDGSGGFALAGTYPVVSFPEAVTVADLNGDGKPDLASANSAANTVSVLTNNGNGTFTLSATLNVGNYPYAITAADLNGDGKPDLVTANYSGGNLSILTNNGNGGFTLSSSPTVGNVPESVIAVDLNQDGKMDLATANAGGNSLSVLTNNGSGSFVMAGTYALNQPSCVTSADVNGDGRPDLIGSSYGNSTLSIYTNNGSGGFGLSSIYSIGSAPYAVLSADVNGDGRPDLVSANSTANTLSVLTNNGNGSFTLVLSPDTGGGPFFVASVDVNGDGKVDLFSANRDASTVTVLTNSTSFPTSSLPIITSQPTGFTNLVGASGALAIGATATGTEPARNLTYQWRLGGTNLPLATNNFLPLLNLALSQAGVYDVVISNYVGSVTSNPAILVVLSAYNLQTSIVGGGTLATNPPGGIYASNTVVTLTATPAARWAFDHWAGDATNGLNPLSITMNGPRNLQAVFVQTSFPLTVSSPGGGSIATNGQTMLATTFFPAGTNVILTAVPSNGWSFIRWQGSNTSTANPLTVTMNQTNVIQAIFGTMVGTNSYGGGIVLSLTNPIPFGTTLTVSAVPDPGNYFVGWAGSLGGTNSPARIVVTNATPTVGALFSALPTGKFSLSVTVVGNGFETNNPPRSYYNSGDSVTLRALTNGSELFLGWTKDATGTNNPLTITMTTNKIIQANFGVLPSVSITPLTQTVLAGSNLFMTASAVGIPPLAYQWQNNSGVIAGATNLIYAITNTQPTNAGNYFVVVTNLYGSTTSTVATVTVIGAPIITNQPPALTTVTVGHSANFSAGAYGWPTLTYRWQFNGSVLNGATSNTFVLPNAFPANAGAYTLVITNIYGSVTSSPAVLAVLPLGITGTKIPAAGQFQFSFDTASGVNYVVQYSTNLNQWFQLITVGGVGFPMTLTDPMGGNRNRFYRILLSP